MSRLHGVYFLKMDWETSALWYWILLAGVGIISAVLGYFFGKSDTPSVSQNTEALNLLEIENTKLKSDLENCHKRLDNSKIKSLDIEKIVGSPKAETHLFDPSEAKAIFGKTIKENDLKLVEGIGPKIEGLFHGVGVKTWESLAECSVDKCQEVLNTGGKRYRIHDPASWPMQAKMAHEGLWQQLFDWQEKHRAGKY
jgi:predicted flap endonuclease-1-like 5' DNA nuclease